MSETRIRVIRPKIGILDLGFSEIWAYRELLYFLVWKEIKIRYKQTVIGAAWAVLQPLLTAIIFAFLLGGTLIKGVPTDGIPYFAFAFTGLILWTYFSNSVTASANSLIVNANLVAKVYFPRALIPLTSCITGLLDYAIGTVMLFIILILFGVALTPMLLLLLLPIALMSILASGLALWLSAIDVKYRDVAYIVPFFIQLLFFATPILYATSLIPKSYEWIIYLNPLSGLFLLQRGIFLGTAIDWILVGISTLLAIIIFFTGMAYFRHYEKRYRGRDLMADPILEIKGVSKSYRIRHQGKEEYWRLSETLVALATHPVRTYQNSRMKKERFWALKDINLTVEKGEMVGIIGRNGAGKSTLLKILSHVTYPAEGEVILRGRVGSLLEVGTGFHPELTGRENIFLNGAILGMRKVDIERQFDAIVKFAEIERFLDTPVKRYSSGMYVRLAFAVAAHLDPEILLVDEVLAVGDIQFQKKCLGRMKDVSEGGRTILFVSHNMKMIEALCSRTMLLHEGKMAMVGKTSDVTRFYTEMGGGSGEIYRVVTKRLEWKGLGNRDRLDELTPDQDVELWLDFQTGAEDVNNLEFEVQLFNDNDVMVLHGKSKLVHELVSSGKGRRFRLRYRFKSPKLAPGRYHMSVIAISGFVYLYVENVDACNVIAKAYFSDAPFLDDVRSVIIPEYSIEVDRDPR